MVIPYYGGKRAAVVFEGDQIVSRNIQGGGGVAILWSTNSVDHLISPISFRHNNRITSVQIQNSPSDDILFSLYSLPFLVVRMNLRMSWISLILLSTFLLYLILRDFNVNPGITDTYNCFPPMSKELFVIDIYPNGTKNSIHLLIGNQ